MEIGAQLFTVRDHCKSLEDFSETLKKIADIGYRNIQVSSTCAFKPQWLKEQLEKNGLKCVLTHAPTAQMLKDPMQTARDHDVFGCRYIGLGWCDFGAEDVENTLKNLIEAYRPVAETFQKRGKYFMYHNHAGEFRKLQNKRIIEHLCEAFTAEEMGVTVDTYWVQVAGADPAQWLEKLAGRVPCIHLKDCAYGQKMAVLGEGNINFDRIFEKAESAGTKYMLVEQDDCYGEDPFACLKRSYEYLRACGL